MVATSADEGAQQHRLAQDLVGLLRLAGADEAGDEGRRAGGDGAKERGGHKDPLVGQADGGQGRRAQVAHQEGVDDADHHAQHLLAHGRQGQAQHVAADGCLVGVWLDEAG